MNKLLFTFAFILLPFALHAACSVAGFNQCLDSACAININANPAARCQLCGTSDAGAAPTGGMTSLSVGASARYTLTATELKSAPTEPGARYAWATGECIKKVADCTATDAAAYDKLIEQSCRAASVTFAMADAQTRDAPKTRATCESAITVCINEKCGGDFTKCESDTEFNKNYSECLISNGNGCDAFSNDIRVAQISNRDRAIARRADVVQDIVLGYQTKRASQSAANAALCTNNAGRDACIAKICTTNMKNNCSDKAPNTVEGTPEESYTSEIAMATALCDYYTAACRTLK